MLSTEAYELWYNGASQHELKAINKAQMLGNLSKSDSKRLADWALDRLGDLDDQQTKADSYKGALGLNAANVAGKHIQHIHAKCADDIKRNMEQYPVISDEEAAKMLFEERIESELAKKIQAAFVVTTIDVG